jgi:hypothetical protein
VHSLTQKRSDDVRTPQIFAIIGANNPVVVATSALRPHHGFGAILAAILDKTFSNKSGHQKENH